MVTFVDGPAKGALLTLRRAPVFLRVVIDSGCKVDALDQVDDTPRPDEAVHVYRLAGEVGTSIVCRRGKGCQTSVSAEYRLNPSQPGTEVARDTGRWQEWCEKQSKGG